MNLQALAMAARLSQEFGVQHKTKFREYVDEHDWGQYHIVISQNSFEHFSDPEAVLEIMKSALAPQGRIYITFAPPWLAPCGSHMHAFTKLPYVNLLFSETTVMRVRSLYRDDGARKYQEVVGGLNKMTVRKFLRLISGSGLRVVYFKLAAVKRLQFLTALPLLRELFVTRVSCILTRQ